MRCDVRGEMQIMICEEKEDIDTGKGMRERERRIRIVEGL
jgi:hypothetical protein